MATTTAKGQQDPNNPENQVNPKWAQQTESILNTLAQGIASQMRSGVAVAEKQPAQDRENWTTIEEAKRYDDMIDKDFVKCDPTSRKPIKSKHLLRVLHWFPEFQTVNSDEFKGKFVVEKWERVKGPNGELSRKIIDSQHVNAKEFLANHRMTIAGSEEDETE